MFSRRLFLKSIGGLGALGVSTTAYGFTEPVVRLGVTRYHLTPPRWPAGFPAQDRGHRRPSRLRSLDVDRSHPRHRRTHQCVECRHHRPARRLRCRTPPCHALHCGRRMGAGVGRIEGPARRARRARQSRLVGRQDRAARRAGADQFPPRARGRRHSGLRKRRQTPQQRTASRSGSPVSAINWPMCRRAGSGRCAASASTISARR